MGQGSIAWLASAPTVAASALDMRITDPRPLLAALSAEEFASYRKPAGLPLEIHTSEPSAVAGEAQARPVSSVAAAVGVIEGHAQVFGNHVDTDAMIPGEFCHLTEPSAIADAAFRYVRPDFRARIARGDDICVAGEGWGSGSSREHAAWALKYSGVKAVIAKSVAYIHKRNLVNEAIPFFLVHDETFHTVVHDGDAISIDASAGVVHLGAKAFHAEPVSPIALKIQSAGGVVSAVQKEGKQAFAV
jgi:aconitate hydratase/homoaconitate hydratase